MVSESLVERLQSARVSSSSDAALLLCAVTSGDAVVSAGSGRFVGGATSGGKSAGAPGHCIADLALAGANGILFVGYEMSGGGSGPGGNVSGVSGSVRFVPRDCGGCQAKLSCVLGISEGCVLGAFGRGVHPSPPGRYLAMGGLGLGAFTVSERAVIAT